MNAHQATDEFITKAVGVVLLLACIPMWWWDMHWPGWLVDIINPVLVTTVAYGLARWKRSRLAWGMFWVLVAIYAVSLVLWVVGGLGLADTSAPAEFGGLVLISIMVCLVQMPRLHPAAAAKVSHVVHHHVLHGADGRAVEVGQYGTGLPSGVDMTQVPDGHPDAIPGKVVRAIESPQIRVGALLARLKQARERN